MTRSKKIFLGIMILFFAFLVGLVIDISNRTTFPGSRKEKGQDSTEKAASVDTTKNHSSPKSSTQQP